MACCINIICVHPSPFHRPSWPKIGEFWVAHGVQMMPILHVWGCHSIQTDSHIHNRHTHKAWAHRYAVHRHTVPQPYTIIAANRWIIFEHSGSLGESKWYHYLMIEADIHLRPLPTFILDMYKVFQLLECCLKGIWVHPYTIPPDKLAPDWGIPAPSWSGNDAITSFLRLPLYSNCFPHSY